MRPLRFSLNLTLDGCYDHTVGIADADLHRNAMEYIAGCDDLLFGRTTYQMMEEAWRMPSSGKWPEWMEPWMHPFARTIDAAKKHVVSSTLREVDWNAEIVRGDLATFVQRLKQQPGKGIGVGGVQLAMALTELGLIDEYQFVVHPRIIGRGPTLFAGLSKMVDLKLVGREEFGSGAVAMRYEVKGWSPDNPRDVRSSWIRGMKEIIFIVDESPEGGYEARALGHPIFTDGDGIEQLKANVKDAVATHFEADQMPKVIRLHMVKEIVIAA